MLFQRSNPPFYADYTRYRPYLRRDFKHRCAYCLVHEGHVGGEGKFCIDHLRPINGPSARPDLECVYSNLYWSCCECNENKGQVWPTQEEESHGLRFIDPCNSNDEHSLHWQSLPNGELNATTNAGAYTIFNLVLWRPQLRHWRHEMYQHQLETEQIIAALTLKPSPANHQILETRLLELRQKLEPPVFDRPRGKNRLDIEMFLPKRIGDE